MKLKKRLVIVIVVGFGLLYAKLTPEQVTKLNMPMATERNDTLVIEEYHKITLVHEIDTPFDNKKHKIIFQRSVGVMPKGIINKEQFIAIYAATSSEITQAIFSPLLQFGAIDSVEKLFTKPKKIDVTISINFKNDGVESIVKSAANEEKEFFPYEKFFLLKFK